MQRLNLLANQHKPHTPKGQMEIIVAGRGNMATAIETLCDKENQAFRRFVPDIQLTQPADQTVVIHVGSGRELPKIFRLCGEHNLVLVQGSGKMEEIMKQAEPLNFVVIDAPNFALPIIQFTALLGQITNKLKRVGMKVTSVRESHQQTKKTVPATALKMASAVDFPKESIESKRDPLIQWRDLDIPREHLNGHGYHWIIFEGGEVTIELSEKVNGRGAYAIGVLQIAKMAVELESQLVPRIYSVQYLIEATWNRRPFEDLKEKI